MSFDSLAAQPHARNDVSRLAELIEANLLEFQSNLSPMGPVHLKMLSTLVGIGFSASMAVGAYKRFEPQMRIFLEAHPNGVRYHNNDSKLLKQFSMSAAEIIRESLRYFDYTDNPAEKKDFQSIAESVRDQMALNISYKAHNVYEAFKPILRAA